MYSQRCTSLSNRNFKFIPAKKILLLLNRGFLRARNTNDKILNFLAVVPFLAMTSGSGIHFQKRTCDIDKIENFKKQLKHHIFLKASCEELPFKQNYLISIPPVPYAY